MVFRFSDFELDADLFELRQSGELVHIEPKVFGLIAHLVRHPDQIFSNDELVESVWAGRIVSDTTISSCVKNARKALGDSGDTQLFIKTVRGRGFRFVKAVARVEKLAFERASNGPTLLKRVNDIPAHNDPSLLVLPFRLLAGAPDCAAFCADLATSVGTVLARIPLLKLSAQTFRYVPRDVYPTVRELHESLGVDFVIEGSIHASITQINIHAQLSDARTGFSLWAEKFTVPNDETEALNKAVIAIVAKAEPQLTRAIYNAVRSRDARPTAQSLFLEASGTLALKGWHYNSFPVARDLLRRSRELSPDFVHAPSYLSFVLGLGKRLGILEDRERVHDEALEAAEAALQLESMDSVVLGITGCALSDLGFSSRALPMLENAIELNRSNAQAWVARGSVLVGQRRLDEAVNDLRYGMMISPLDNRL